MQHKRVYIAAKLGKSEPEVQKLKRELEALGYEIIYDWTEHLVLKPFADHEKEADEAAEAMAHAVMQCDILVVLCTEEGGAGYFMEAGGALIASIVLSFITGQKTKHIFAVGKGNDRSVFYFNRRVRRISNVDVLLEVLREL